MKKKTRLVIFRVPEEDYTALTNWSSASGARSVSEFVRLAVLEKVEALGARRLTFTGDLKALGKTLGDLDDRLREASKNIRRLLGPAGREEEPNDAEELKRGTAGGHDFTG